MRIITGLAKGRPLQVPDEGTRPATDRTREAVFSMLGPHNIQATRVLDLFAGSGAYGLEALSRGAAHATFVDQSRKAKAALLKNSTHSAFDRKHQIIEAEVNATLRRLQSSNTSSGFDLVFADPPYVDSHDFEKLEAVFSIDLLLPILAPKAILVLEMSEATENLLPYTTGLEMLASRCYGSTRIEFYQSP